VESAAELSDWQQRHAVLVLARAKVGLPRISSSASPKTEMALRSQTVICDPCRNSLRSSMICAHAT